MTTRVSNPSVWRQRCCPNGLISVSISLLGLFVLYQQPAVAQPECPVVTTATNSEVVWQNGRGTRWDAPTAVSGGVSIIAQQRVDVAATDPFAKIKFAASVPVSGMQWLSFKTRSNSGARFSVYLYSSALGDTYSRRCIVNTSTNWQTVRVRLSTFGADTNTPIDQIRFRNEANGSIQYSLNAVGLDGDTVSPPDIEPPTVTLKLPARSRMAYWHESAGVTPTSQAT